MSGTRENGRLRLPKPEFPYEGGKSLFIRGHIPPAPRPSVFFHGAPKRPTPRRILSFQENSKPPYSEPPSTGPIPDDNRDGYSLQETDTLLIIRELKVKNGRPAQVLLCRRDSNGMMCVAKVFDPLYELEQGWYYADDPHPRDQAGFADCNYTVEAAAYEQLDPYIGGSAIPKYYGSWTTNMAIQLSTELATRVVCLVLMEYIPGPTLRSLDDHPNLSEEHRDQIMAQVIAAETRVKSFGVHNNDFSERNIICCGELLIGDRVNPDLRVVVVDFNFSSIDHLAREAKGLPPTTVPSKPMSPIQRWWFGWPCIAPDVSSFHQCWFPNTFDPKSQDITVRPWRLWLIKHFGGSKEYQDPPADMIAENASESWSDRRSRLEAEAMAKRRTPDADTKTKGRTPDANTKAKAKRHKPQAGAKTKRRRQK